MPIFKLKQANDNIDEAVLIAAKKTSLELEKHLEGWLENSPWAIAQEPLLIIGRQTSATQGECVTIFPDLLGLDKDGNIVVIELKRGRTPREVIAQILEYAAWANDLSDEEICKIALNYFEKISNGRDLKVAFFDTFEAEELPALNQRQRLFVAAEEISPSVLKVSRFLRQAHGLDINCIQYSIFQTQSGEILVSSEASVGMEDIVTPKKSVTQRWAGEKSVRQVIWEGVLDLTKGDKEKVFSPKDVCQLVLQKYPNFNKSTATCQIICDCVNHSSRHHYTGGEDKYWWIEKGKYKLYDSNTDR